MKPTRSRMVLTLSAATLLACGSSSSGPAADASSPLDGHADAHPADAHAADAPADRSAVDAHPAEAATHDGGAGDVVSVDAPSHDATPDAVDSAPGDALSHDAPSHDAAPDAVDSAPGDAPSQDVVAETGDSGPCHATPGPADQTRKIVVSHPYDDSQNASADFEVFELDSTGTITEPNVHFTLGTTTNGNIAFTPDGMVGIVVEDDGTLGVFRFDAAGAPHVVTASLSGSYYATGVVMDPSGARAYILDEQTVDNGGGIYSVTIACDGTLHDDGLLASAELPAAIIPVAGGDAVIAAESFLDVPPLPDGGFPDAGASSALAVLVPWPSAASVVGSANPFGDDQAIVSSAALTQDGKYVLIGDNNSFSESTNRIGVVTLGAGTITAAGVVPNVNDPEAIVASPFDNTLLVTSAFGNALYLVRPSADAGATPFALTGELTYAGPTPQLPGIAAMIGRGALQGRVLVAEVQAIRQVQFAAAGVVTDLGPTNTGDLNSFTSIVGAMGVQP